MSKYRKKLVVIMENLLFLGGMVAIVIGCGIIWTPLSWIVGGMMFAVCAVFSRMSDEKRSEKP